MTNLDLWIVAVYVLAQFFFGLWLGLRESSEEFLVFSRRAGVLLILFSVVSSWVGVGVIVGTAAAGFDTGISFGLTGAMGAMVAVGSIALFAPTVKRFGDKYQAHTIGDFFGVRYSKRARLLSSLVVSVVYLLLTAVQFTGLAALLRIWGGLPFETAVIVAGISTIVYTAFAGIKSDFYTDVVHFCVMAVVLFGVLVPAMFRVTEGFSSLRELPQSYFDPLAFGGWGYFLGGIVFGIGVVLVSMELWQRIYAASAESVARRGLIASAIVVVPFYLVAAAAGMVVQTLRPNLADRDLALFVLMQELLPPVALGLGVAAFVAVFISSVNTMIMVVSASLTKDLYLTFFRPDASERSRLLVARLATALAGIIGVGLSYLVQDIITLSIAALFLLLVLLPAVLGGFYWKRSTEIAAVASILGGVVVTAAAFPFFPETAFIPAFLVSVVVFVVVALFTSRRSGGGLVSEV